MIETMSSPHGGRLQGKVAMVTGAANGIGRGCALRFAQEGAHVIAVDRDGDGLRQLVDAGMEVRGGVDLVDEAAVETLFGSIERLDILVNAAAFATFAWIEDLRFEDWRHTLSGELDIVFLATRRAWPILQRSGAAAIVNFTSANAYHALFGSPALAHCAGKGGVLAMTRQLAMEGAPFGIRANSISPGFVLSAATQAHIDRDPAFEQQVLAKNMIKRLGRPEDIAACATWLVSDEAGYVTGTDVHVDGGATAW